MATAVLFKESAGGATIFTIKGLVLEGFQISPRLLQNHDRKFWGVAGVSRIFGEAGQREIIAPVLIYDSANVDFNTAEKLSDFIDETLNTTHTGKNGWAEFTSEADHDPYTDITFEGAMLLEGPKLDVIGNLGGGYWAVCLFQFTQLS
jgi:hypothetical protein